MEENESSSLFFCNYKLEEVLLLLEATKEFVYTKGTSTLNWEQIATTLPFSPKEAKLLWKRIAYKPHDTTPIQPNEEEDSGELSQIEDSVTFKYKKRRPRSQLSYMSESSTSTTTTTSSVNNNSVYNANLLGSINSYHSSQSTNSNEPSSPLNNQNDQSPLKRMKLSNDDDELKKRIPWTPEEDDLLINGIDKLGEGNWTAIRQHTKLNRLPSQLSQHWLALKKRAIKNTDQKSLTIQAIISRHERQKTSYTPNYLLFNSDVNPLSYSPNEKVSFEPIQSGDNSVDPNYNESITITDNNNNDNNNDNINNNIMSVNDKSLTNQSSSTVQF